jgi:hypothetical protein
MQGGKPMAKRSTTVELDVHKESMDVVIAEGGAEGEVRHYGTIGGKSDSALTNREVNKKFLYADP